MPYSQEEVRAMIRGNWTLNRIFERYPDMHILQCKIGRYRRIIFVHPSQGYDWRRRAYYDCYNVDVYHYGEWGWRRGQYSKAGFRCLGEVKSCVRKLFAKSNKGGRVVPQQWEDVQ